jgi:hypothetical protein
MAAVLTTAELAGARLLNHRESKASGKSSDFFHTQKGMK